MSHHPSTLVAVLLCSFVVFGCPALLGQCTPAWDASVGVPGANGPVFAVETYDDGTGPALYVGGSFTSIGGVSAPGLAKWNGTTWSALGVGVIDFGPVRTLEVFDDGMGPRLFIGGQFFGTGGNLIALVTAYDGTTWDDLAGGMEGPIVSDFAVYDDGTGPKLFAGGTFSTAGGNSVEGIARWTGTTWSALGTGISGDVYALAVHDEGMGENLFIGGLFSLAGGVGVANIARWNGTAYSQVGAGLNLSVWTMASFAGSLVVGGDFTTAGGNAVARITSWDGAAYFDLGGANLNPWTMRVADIEGIDHLVIGGAFTTIGGVAANRIAAWDGFGFAPLAGGTDSDVRALAVKSGPGALPNGLYVGGLFAAVDGVPASGVARFDTCTPGPSGVVFERGDVNADGMQNIADAIVVLNRLFSPGVTLLCDEAAEVNDDDSLNIADAIYLLAYLFQAGAPVPPPPFGSCDVDSDNDPVTCDVPSPAC